MGAASHGSAADLPAALRSAYEPGSGAATTDASPARQPRPDIAVLATHPRELLLRLPAEANRLSELRRRLEEFLTAHGVPEADVFDVIMAVSEAAANAVEHPVEPAEPVIGIETTVTDDAIVVTVRDTGSWRTESAPGFRGRGLALIGALTELTVRRSPAGTAVTLRRLLATAPAAGRRPLS